MASPKKRTSAFSAGRAKQHIVARFNPISGLTPRRLSSYLDAFDHGYLRNAAETWEKIAERDDQVITCATKRLRAAARLNWEILPIDDSPEARRHKEILEEFYNNLTTTSVLDEDERGDTRLLIRQMLTAVGMRYAVHEIVWQPRSDGLSAEFRFVPLQFFERRQGRLRFLPSDLAVDGVDLEPAGWMVARGDGLMIATSIAYMFKTMPLKAWVTHCEKFGIPGVHAKTDAVKDSPEWQELVEAVGGFGEDLALVTNQGASIEAIATGSASNQPHPPLVERMDRAISRIWLGGDLATMSAGQGSVGAMPQSLDLEKLEEDDAGLVSSTLQQYVDRHVIRFRTGQDKPMAYFKLQPTKRQDTDRDLKVDEFLVRNGVPVGKKDLLERYGRPEPDAGDELATAPATPAAPSPFGPRPFANTRPADARYELFRAQALRRLNRAQAEALRPITDRLSEILGMDDEAMQDAALLKLQNDLPAFLKANASDPALVSAWEAVFGAALASGAVEAAQEQHRTAPRSP
jgi:hypothetical protein